MKILTMSIIMLFLLTMNILAQGLPEPTNPAITYEYEIGWGNNPVSVWTAITPTSTVIASGVVSSTHIYSGNLGNNKFEFATADSTTTVPMKGVVIFNIASIPSTKLFDIFRIRVRASATYNGQIVTSAWSDPSYWVMVMNLKKLNQPVSIK